MSWSVSSGSCHVSTTFFYLQVFVDFCFYIIHPFGFQASVAILGSRRYQTPCCLELFTGCLFVNSVRFGLGIQYIRGEEGEQKLDEVLWLHIYFAEFNVSFFIGVQSLLLHILNLEIPQYASSLKSGNCSEVSTLDWYEAILFNICQQLLIHQMVSWDAIENFTRD